MSLTVYPAKNRNVNRTFPWLLALFLLGGFCAKDRAFGQKNDKGPAKHPAPSMVSLPLKTTYDFSRPLPASLSDRLHTTVAELYRKRNFTGLTVALAVPGKGFWQADTGFVSLSDQRRVDSATIFYWASVGKTVTAAVIAQLVREKTLRYDDPLSRWYPAIPQADLITVDNLLTHTSGLYSFNADSTFHYATRHYPPDELLAIALAKPSLFGPGEYWSYSNTGYLLLALIAEKTEGKPFAQIVQDRIARPLGLHGLKILAPEEVPTNLALAHENGRTVPQRYSLPLGAGNIVAPSGDMLRFFAALLGGKLLPPADLQYLLRDLYPMFEKGQYYGRGLMLYDFADLNQSANRWIGHSGGTGNYRSVVAYDLQSRALVAVAINENQPAEALAYKVLGIVQSEK